MTNTQSVVPGTTHLQVTGARKPYHRPAIVTHEPMEALAALCSPTSGGKAAQPICNPTKS